MAEVLRKLAKEHLLMRFISEYLIGPAASLITFSD